MSVIRRNENASQWETVPGSRVPVVVCTARAICISTAKFDYVDDDEVGDIKCFPLFSFSLEQRGGREKGKGVHTHTYQLRYASFVLISNLFQSFPTIFFVRPFVYALQKFHCANRKRISKVQKSEFFDFAQYILGTGRTFINKIANARFRSIALSIAKLELLGSSSINWRRCTDGSVVIFFRPYNFQNFLAPCPRSRNIIDRERCIGVRMDRLWLHISWMQMERRLIFSSSLQLTRFPGTHARPRSSICSRVCRSRVGK